MPHYWGFDELTQKTYSTYRIFLYAFSTQETFSFPAFITDFNDSFSSTWTTQEIYGKMDPVATFRNTTRTINLSFDMPAANLAESKSILDKIDSLIKGLYPIYSENKSGASMGTANIVAPPLFRIEFRNYMMNASTAEGLLGYLTGFDFKPDMSMGSFIHKSSIYPKLTKASLVFKVLHEHPLGSKMLGDKPFPRITVDNGTKYTEKFPHAANSIEYNTTNGQRADVSSATAGAGGETQQAEQAQSTAQPAPSNKTEEALGSSSQQAVGYQTGPILPEQVKNPLENKEFIKDRWVIVDTQRDGNYILKNQSGSKNLYNVSTEKLETIKSLGGSVNGE